MGRENERVMGMQHHGFIGSQRATALWLSTLALDGFFSLFF